MQACQQIWDCFRQEFTQLWDEAVAEGRGGDLTPSCLYGPDAAGGTQALKVSLQCLLSHALPVSVKCMAGSTSGKPPVRF